MRVSIGTIEVDDTTRKAIRREMGQKGVASRDDVKKYVEEKLAVVFANAGEQPVAASADEPVTAPPAADELPNPPSAGLA